MRIAVLRRTTHPDRSGVLSGSLTCSKSTAKSSTGECVDALDIFEGGFALGQPDNLLD